MQKIKEMLMTSKSRSTKIFFDVDGVCAELVFIPGGVNDKINVYQDKRPIKTVVNIMRKMQRAGAEVYVLSLCNYNYQKEEKMEWFKKYLSFLKKENALVIAKKEKEAQQIDKHLLKPYYIKEIVKPNDTVYFIDDNHENLKGMHDVLPFLNCVHISQFIK